MLNLDTHVLIFALSDQLSSSEKKLLNKHPWSISPIVLWEICKLVQLGRIELDLEDRDFKRAVSQVHVWPLSLEICRTCTTLDFKSDPADEIIASTSVVHRVPLLTRDKRLRASKMVPLA